MFKNKWIEVAGTSNLGENETMVAARISENDILTIAYAAYSGLKLVELSGVTDCEEGEFTDADIEIVNKWVDNYYEVAFKGIVGGVPAYVIVNECDGVTLVKVDKPDAFWVGSTVEVTDVSEYTVHEYEDISDELLSIFMYT